MSSFPLTLPLLLVVSTLCFNSFSYAREQRNQFFFEGVDVNSLLDSDIQVPCKHSYTGKKEGAVSLEVVHRARSTTATSRSEMWVADQKRVDSIHATLFSGRSVAALESKLGISIGTQNYIVSVGLGTPPKNLPLVFDTGSDVTWARCRSSYNKKEPTFDPASSSSYATIPCKAKTCTVDLPANGVTDRGCSSNNTCTYVLGYEDRSTTSGILSKEKLSLTSDYYIDNFVFGCSDKSEGLLSGSTGIIGLGRAKLSLVSQANDMFGDYFSYCLPSTSCSTGHLTLGPGAMTTTDFSYTPLLRISNTDLAALSFYFVDLQHISVAGRKLPISPTTSAGTIIDSGTVISRLPPSAYTDFSNVFKQYMSNYPSVQMPGESDLKTCFNMSSYKTVSIPKVALYFDGGGVIDLPANGILIEGDKGVLCLAFAPNEDDTKEGVLGNIQQKGFDVVYDVAAARPRIGFGPGGC